MNKCEVCPEATTVPKLGDQLAASLTVRQLFIGMTYAGMNGNPEMNELEPDYIASLSIRWADALLEELEKAR